MKKRYVAAFLTAGITGGYYSFAQQNSPENAHPETLERSYIAAPITAAQETCLPSLLNNDERKLKCAQSLFAATAQSYSHWHNSMAQSLYDSFYGTLLGDMTEIASLAKTYGDACGIRPAQNVADIADSKDISVADKLKTVSDHVEKCADLTQEQRDHLTNVKSQFITSDFASLRSMQAALQNSIK